MKDETCREGWAPVIGEEVSLTEAIEQAFDYRGNVTLELADGSEFTGYLFNRNATVAAPFVELFDLRGRGPFRFRYTDIRGLRFTGKDTAQGKTYEAWLRKQATKVTSQPAGAADE